ncbi:mannonate dehydratase [uncultured Paludibaculum sp.]|uniref:mannonate dehydratase n=1 Tax=uncultured Paludibaculum sp. TaxID=1765020 RepID=UPI002AAAA2B5|nr:mannonate dehydratase [uncultured Paludibaculum sp.]
MIQLAELFEPGDTDKIRIAVQAGITHAIVRTAPLLAKVPRQEYLSTLRRVKDEMQAAGLVFAGVESHPVSAERVKLGLAGRDEEIENYIAVIRALGEVGVRTLCYNWMAGLGWYRTRVNIAERGGALVSGFDIDDARHEGLTEWGEIDEETIWANLEYFLKAVLPVAEAAGVRMALHPDDPPVSPLRGIGRILTSAEAFRRVLGMHPGPANGITFCQATFGLMGEDIGALIREWCGLGRIYFVHLRDVTGTRERFRETFHDNGPTNLAATLRLYHEAGFDGPLRPDHAPTMQGEANDRPGYAMKGKILAIGYMKGALDANGIPYARGFSG